MALLSELIKVCADQKVDSEPTLTLFGRRLREAGRISTAGRGRGAAHMTYLDASRFLIACAATDRPEQAAHAESVFSSLLRTPVSPADEDDKFPMSADEFDTLDLALAEVLRLIADGETVEVAKSRSKSEHCYFEVFRGTVGARVRILNGTYDYFHKDLADMMISASPAVDPVGGWSEEVGKFYTGKNLTAQIEIGLLKAVAKLIKGDSE